MNRRQFVRTTVGATLAASAAGSLRAQQAPNVIAPKSVKPVVISSANGNKFKNGGDVTCVQKAFTMMTGGADVLDALIAGVNILELDPGDTSVGYGGLPNADGVVQLDACCMHGPKRRAGGVGESRGSAHAGERGAEGDGDDRPSSHRRPRRAEIRAEHGLQD
jgi:N4-(beta-N-acetylglucosaminyl)-L-asparaginase